MPYPIPDNLDNIEGWRWYLVPLPDDDQMIQVAWGMWSELTHFWNWGKEGPIPEQSEKAAQLWAAALYEAWRIRDMGFPDLILTYIDEVESLLEAIRDRPCCDGSAITDTITDPEGVVQPIGDETGQDINWDIGDPPGGLSTWAEATTERCAQAETFAAGLSRWITVLQGFQTALDIGYALAIAGLIAGLASVGLVGGAIIGAFSVGGILAFRDEIRALLDSEPDYETARAQLDDPDTIDAVVCAIITSPTAAAAESAVDAALASLAPTAAPLIAVLPLRFMMGRIFNLDGDGSGFGGPCRECTEPDLTCSECLSNPTCLPEISLVMSKLQGSCPNYSIVSFEEVSRHHFRAVVSVTSSTSECTLVRWHINPVGTVDMAGMRLTATVVSGSPPDFSVFGGPSLLNGSKDVVVCGPQVWRSCLTPLYDYLDTAWPLQISASFGTACTMQLDINILEAANDQED